MINKLLMWALAFLLKNVFPYCVGDIVWHKNGSLIQPGEISEISFDGEQFRFDIIPAGCTETFFRHMPQSWIYGKGW